MRSHRAMAVATSATMALVVVALLVPAVVRADAIYLSYSRFIVKFGDSVSLSFDANKEWCFTHGGVPAADPNQMVNSYMVQALGETRLTSSPLTFYIGGTGKPYSEDAKKTCAEMVSGTGTDKPYSYNCRRRWLFGFWDIFSTDTWEGTPYLRGLQWDDSRQPSMNGFDDFIWNSSFDRQVLYPRGYYGHVCGLHKGQRLLRMDAMLSFNTQSSPNTIKDYVTVCEVQDTILGVAPFVKADQPSIVPGWKEDSWSERHWYAVFILVAVAILIAFAAVALFCCATKEGEPVGPAIMPLVVRERKDRAYVVDDENADLAVKPGESDQSGGLSLNPQRNNPLA